MSTLKNYFSEISISFFLFCVLFCNNISSKFLHPFINIFQYNDIFFSNKTCFISNHKISIDHSGKNTWYCMTYVTDNNPMPPLKNHPDSLTNIAEELRGSPFMLCWCFVYNSDFSYKQMYIICEILSPENHFV